MNTKNKEEAEQAVQWIQKIVRFYEQLLGQK